MGYANVKALQNLRCADRYPTRIHAEMTVDHKSSTILIADLSRAGALIRGVDLPDRGMEVVLCASGLEVLATVVWRTEDHCGLNFHRSINPLEVVRNNKWFTGGKQPVMGS